MGQPLLGNSWGPCTQCHLTGVTSANLIQHGCLWYMVSTHQLLHTQFVLPARAMTDIEAAPFLLPPIIPPLVIHTRTHKQTNREKK